MKLLLAWERLPVPAQAGIAFPLCVVILFLFHLGPLNQPVMRAVFYGFFWSVLATPVVVLASQNEARKRRQGDGSVHGS
ncbi:MAG: hypothetical protein QOF68_2352 [Gaiellales bacterium]|jgi:hypothetical protein|nr:hypothetical protein [Gaiellales bacterium]